jgi:general secretion pathway protein K
MNRSRTSQQPGSVLGNQSGIALVLVLLVIALLTAMILEFDFKTRLDLRSAGNFRDDTGAYLLADSAVQVARVLLYEDRLNSGYDSADEDWGIPIVNQEVAPDHFVTVVITDEDGKFNLNTLIRAPDDADEATQNAADDRKALLERLMIDVLEMDSVDALVMIDSVMDWIDADDTNDGDGAESSYYETLENPYRCRNGYLRSFDELGLIRGFNAEAMEKLSPHVTVIWEGAAPTSPTSPININTASPELLMALHPDITEEIAGNIMEARPFEQPGDVKSAGLQGKVHALGEEIAQRIVPFVRRDSDHFSVLARGAVGDTVRTVRAQLSRRVTATSKGPRLRVTAWRVE